MMIHRIFSEWSDILPKIGKQKYYLPGVKRETLVKWFEQGAQIEPLTARQVALAVCERVKCPAAKDPADLGERLGAVVRAAAPQAPAMPSHPGDPTDPLVEWVGYTALPTRLHQIFYRWKKIFPNQTTDSYFLPGVDIKTSRPWFDRGAKITRLAAHRVSSAVYGDYIEKKKGPCAQLLGVVEEMAPEILPEIERYQEKRVPFSASMAELAASEGVLALSLDVLVAPRDGKTRGSFKSVMTEKVVPVADRQRMQIEVQATFRCCIYAIWITPTGKLQGLYPWNPAKGYEVDADANSPRKELHIPPFASWGFECDPGLETLVAFATRKKLTGPQIASLAEKFQYQCVGAVDQVIEGVFRDNLAREALRLEEMRRIDVLAPQHVGRQRPRPAAPAIAPYAVRERHRYVAQKLREWADLPGKDAVKIETVSCLSFGHKR